MGRTKQTASANTQFLQSQPLPHKVGYGVEDTGDLATGTNSTPTSHGHNDNPNPARTIASNLVNGSLDLDRSWEQYQSSHANLEFLAGHSSKEYAWRPLPATNTVFQNNPPRPSIPAPITPPHRAVPPQPQMLMQNTAFLSGIRASTRSSPIPQTPLANMAFLSATQPSQTSAPRVEYIYRSRVKSRERSRSRDGPQIDDPSRLRDAGQRAFSSAVRSDVLTSDLSWQYPSMPQDPDCVPVFPQISAISSVRFSTDSRTWADEEPLAQSTDNTSNSYSDNSTNLSNNGTHADTVQTFAYPRLRKSTRSIRLLRIDPIVDSPRFNKLNCTLVTVQPWTEDVTYECLSYCWGTCDTKRSIFVRSSSDVHYKPVLITENLYNALRRLQHTHESRYLWIDALCINQSDVEERSSQVSMMKDIYKSAAGIAIWLGETTVSLSAAVTSITALSNRFQADTSTPIESIIGTAGLLLTFEDIERLKTYTSKSPEYAYKLIAHFFSLPYFRRVWVLQEVFSQSNVVVHLGDQVLSWGSVILAAFWQSCFTRSFTSTTADSFRGLDAKAYLPELWLGLLHTRPSKGLPMLELASRARDFAASDLRDKVFALLGLANDLGEISTRRAGLRPDYRKSIAEVYTAFAKDLIMTIGDLDVLSLVDTFSLGTETIENAPSWMPNLNVSIATIRGLGYPRKYNASFSSKIYVDVACQSAADLRTLQLSGFVVDRIQVFTPSILTFSRELKLYIDRDDAIISLWWKFVRPQSLQNGSTDSEETVLQMYLELLTATGFAMPTDFPAHPLGKVIPSREAPFIIADFAAYWSRIDPEFTSFGEACRKILQRHVESGDADQFVVLAGKACHDRKFFVSSAGRMGLCPRHVESGDVIAILYGGSVPYVVREINAGEWMFVGECYLDGLMFGEAANLERKEQVFCIV